ncbi:MAG: BCCT family transporter [Spirochaetes bacterium]|nr:BCCT family transporter [Spirochaetota bacterium]
MSKLRNMFQLLDKPIIIVPLVIVTALFIVFFLYPERSTEITDLIRGFLGNQLGTFYIVLGLSIVLITLYIAFSKYGKIRLGKMEKPLFPDYKWAIMIFTSVFAADLIFYSLIEWAMYAEESRIHQMGGTPEEWQATFPLFHWGPIPWGFYVMLATSFAFMLHTRGRTKQKFSEACRPLLGDKVDGAAGKVIDIIAICALIAGTATTFSLVTPLLSATLSRIFGFGETTIITVMVLVLIAMIYTITVFFGIKGIVRAGMICAMLFLGMIAFILFFGGQTQFIVEMGVTSIGNLAQNFIGLSTWMDPMRSSCEGYGSFVQNWTIFFWAYWMAWCVATPFFLGIISKGRTIKNVILGTYGYGLAGTFLSFIVFGNYALSQHLAGNVDVINIVTGGLLCASGQIIAEPYSGQALSHAIISIFDTLPLSTVLLAALFIMLVIFYSTTFDSLTYVVSSYSYKKLHPGEESANMVRAFWAIVFIIFPIGLIFAENSINSLMSVSIIAAFPIGIVFCIIIASFFKDAKMYLKEQATNK